MREALALTCHRGFQHVLCCRSVACLPCRMDLGSATGCQLPGKPKQSQRVLSRFVERGVIRRLAGLKSGAPHAAVLGCEKFGPRFPARYLLRIQGRTNSNSPLIRNASILWSDLLVRLQWEVGHRVLEAVSKSVAGAIGIVTQSQEIGELSHGGVGMLVIDGVGVIACHGSFGCDIVVDPKEPRV